MNRAVKIGFISILVLASLVLHWRIFHLDLIGQHVWRQTQTQLNILHFAKDDADIFNPRTNYLDTPGGIHRMEFPLMQWTIGMSGRLFGYSVFLSRLFMFLAGILAAIGMGKLAKEISGNIKAFPIAAWLITFSPLFYYYTMNPLPDVWALASSTWGMAFFFQWQNNSQRKYLLPAGIFLSIGALIKLPFILYFILFKIYILQKRKEGLFATVSKTLIGWIWVILPVVWYAAVIPTWSNNPVVGGMLQNNSKSFSNLLYVLRGNLVSTLPEILVNYAALPLFLFGFWIMRRKEVNRKKHFIQLFAVSLFVLAYFLFELHLIATNHDYYLFPFLPLIILISTAGAVKLSETHVGRIVVIVCLLVLPTTAFLRMNSRWDMDDPGFNKDLFVASSSIQKIVPSQDKIFCIGDVSGNIWFYYLDRSGWNAMYDVSNDYLYQRINDGAKWIVTDSKSAMERVRQGIYYESVMEVHGFYIIRVNPFPKVIN